RREGCRSAPMSVVEPRKRPPASARARKKLRMAISLLSDRKQTSVRAEPGQYRAPTRLWANWMAVREVDRYLGGRYDYRTYRRENQSGAVQSRIEQCSRVGRYQRADRYCRWQVY